MTSARTKSAFEIAAIPVFLFIAVLVMTVLQFRLSRRWVYYAGGG